MLRERFASFSHRAMPANNLRQADVPSGARYLRPERGTAPGLAAELPGGALLYAVAGVPGEMVEMMEGTILPELAERSGAVIASRVIRLTGMGESAVAEVLADLYEAMGGKVVWYGKPHETIYSHALHLAGNPEKASVLAIGDGLQTDMLGAATRGFDTIFISGGIHAGEDFPADFAARYGFGDWKPIAVVEGLA
jgi:molybdopterin-biosynthesis enzyme MoeA-like protein